MPELSTLFVNQIDIVVKPGADGSLDPRRYKTPTYQQLLKAWYARLNELVLQDDALVIYYSDLPQITSIYLRTKRKDETRTSAN